MWERISVQKIIVVIVIVFLLIVILGVRFPARAQDLSTGQWIEEIQRLLQEFTGQPVEVKTLSSTVENPELFALLGSEEDSFVVKRGELYRSVSLGELPQTEGSGSLAAVQIALSQQLVDENEAYDVVAFVFDKKISYVFIPKSGGLPAGVLIALSREFVSSIEPALTTETGCSKWIPLSLNILRRPAEQIQVCAKAICQAAIPKSCAITSINREVGLFANLQTMPNPPSDMTAGSNLCKSDIAYGISYLNFSVNALVLEFDIGFEMGGALESEVDCLGSVTVNRLVGSN